MGQSLNYIADQDIKNRKHYVKAFKRVRGESYDFHLKMYYHADQDPEVRKLVVDELQRRGAVPVLNDVRSETITCRSLTIEEARTIPNLFVLDPSNYQYLNGTASRTRPKLWSIYIPALVIAILIALFFGFFTVRDVLASKQIQDSGVATQAEITNLNRIAGTNSKSYTTSTRYEVVYKFVDTTNKQYTNKIDIPFNLYNSLKVGSIVDILYVPSDPSNSRLKDVAPNLLGGAFGTGFFVLLALLVFFLIRSQRKTQQQLANSGQLLQAQVIESAGYKTKGGYELAVGFACRMADNTILWGIESRLRNDLKDQSVLPIGASAVLEYAGAKNFELL
jgi:hypothetical protein